MSALCQEVNAALAEPSEEVRARVQAEDHANVDETGWEQAGERRWLRVAVTAVCTCCVVARKRSGAVLSALLGEAYGGAVSSDRYTAYLSIPIERRQICWAHLKRHLVALGERDGEIGDRGKEAVGVVEQVFAAWYRSKAGGGDRVALQAETSTPRTQLQGLWERGTTLPSWLARAFCTDVTKLEPARWTFVTVERVEPPNTAAERAVRPAVLWRKGCFGADSDAGNTCVTKILTASATCRQQKRHVLTYLTTAVSAHREGNPAPSRLPV